MSELFPLALPEGTVLAGQYIIQKTLGQGGFGITYMATDHKTGGKVAVKEFFPDTLATRMQNTVSSYPGERTESFEYGKQCFLQEAETLAQFIGSENIVRIHSYFEENSTAYFVMDFVEGTSFDEYIRQKGGKIPYAEAERFLLPVMDALSLVHSKGIVHRDVTPDNIYITNEGTVKLLDFGAARYSLGDRSRSLDVVLKHGFAPKEQYTRHGRQGPFTDVYTVGASFYYAITGRRPPDSIDRLEEDDLIPPSSLGVAIPPQKEDAVLKAMSVQPGDRYQTMDAFREALLGEAQPQRGTAPSQPVGQKFFDAPENRTQAVAEPAAPQEAAAQAAPPAADAAAQTGREDEVNHCVKCGARLLPGAKTCTVCGADQQGSSGKERKKRRFLSSPKNRKFVCAGLIALALAVVFVSAAVILGSRWKKNVLMEDDGAETDKVLGSNVFRSGVTAIVITDSLREMPETAWDVSADGNGRVMAWTSQMADGLTLYIGGKGGVSLGESARGLFQGYTALKNFQCKQSEEKIVLHMDRVKDMNHMFAGCASLEEISFGSVDDYLNMGNVTDMSYMFADCAGLEKIFFYCLDMPKVENVRAMFQNCGSLTKAAGGIIDSSSVTTDLSGMFQNCASLTDQYLVDGIPDTAEKLNYMFAGCENLVEPATYRSSWSFFYEIQPSADVSAMFYGCDSFRENLNEGELEATGLTQEQIDSLWTQQGLTGTSDPPPSLETSDASLSLETSDPPSPEEIGWDEEAGEAPGTLLPPPDDRFLESELPADDKYEELEPAIDSFAVNNIKNEGRVLPATDSYDSFYGSPNGLTVNGNWLVKDVDPRAMWGPGGHTSLFFVNGRDGCVYGVDYIPELSDGTDESTWYKAFGFAGKGTERYRIRTCYMSYHYVYVWAEDGNGENGRLCRFSYDSDDEIRLNGLAAVESPRQVTFTGGYVYYIGKDAADGHATVCRMPAGGDWSSPEQLVDFSDILSPRELLTDGEQLYVWMDVDSEEYPVSAGFAVFDLNCSSESERSYGVSGTEKMELSEASVYAGHLYFIARRDDGSSCSVMRVPVKPDEAYCSPETLFEESGCVMEGLTVWKGILNNAELDVMGVKEGGFERYFVALDPDGSYEVMN